MRVYLDLVAGFVFSRGSGPLARSSLGACRRPFLNFYLRLYLRGPDTSSFRVIMLEPFDRQGQRLIRSGFGYRVTGEASSGLPPTAGHSDELEAGAQPR